MNLSIILPAKDEEEGLSALLPALNSRFPSAEIIVVDDGSTDRTASVATNNGAIVVHHPYCIGNGGAVKTGARTASGEIAVFMDSDGQHNPDEIPRLLEKLEEGYDMVVGARTADTHSSLLRRFGNSFYNRLASFMTGYRIEDLTSGFRAVHLQRFRQFLYLLPNGFSYPTTSTMAFFRSGYPVAYIPIRARTRQGSNSAIRIIKDGMRFFVIVLKVGALYSPMRLFLPVSAGFFGLGLIYYAYTFLTAGRFTNMGALLFITALTTFLIGIVSEQVSSLHYRNMEKDGE